MCVLNGRADITGIQVTLIQHSWTSLTEWLKLVFHLCVLKRAVNCQRLRYIQNTASLLAESGSMILTFKDFYFIQLTL